MKRDLLALMATHSADAADVMAALKEIVMGGAEYIHNHPSEYALLLKTARLLDEAAVVYRSPMIGEPNPPSKEELLAINRGN